MRQATKEEISNEILLTLLDAPDKGMEEMALFSKVKENLHRKGLRM